jgi:hypothetical protein
LLLEVIKSAAGQAPDTQPAHGTDNHRDPYIEAHEGWAITWHAVVLGGAGLVVVAVAVGYAMTASVSSAGVSSDLEAHHVELKHRPASEHGTAAEQAALLHTVKVQGLVSRVDIS